MIPSLAVLIATGLACAACSSSKLGSPAGSGGRGGSVLTGMGGGDAVGTGGDGGGGRGGEAGGGRGGEAGGGRGGEAGGGRGGEAGGGRGGVAGGGVGGIAGYSGRGGGPPSGGGGDAYSLYPCMPENPRAVIACGDALSVSSVALAPEGKAVVSLGHRVGGAVMKWDNTGTWKEIGGASSGSLVRLDSQGRPVLAYSRMEAGVWMLDVQRLNGTSWDSLTGGLAVNGQYLFDFEIDALDRPVLLLLAPSSPSGNVLTVHRLESGTWVQLGGAAPINNSTATNGRLALDSADGVTPYVAYRPDGATQETIVLSRLTSAGWSQAPALTRASNAGFDLAVAGGQPSLAYIDGTTDDGRLFISQVGTTGWSAGVALNSDTNRPVSRTRIVATGPSPGNLIVGYDEFDPTFRMYQVSFKRGPDWSSVPGSVPPVAGADMQKFEMAVDASRIAVVWTVYQPGIVWFLAYHEFPR
jgi:hypothetical protein